MFLSVAVSVHSQLVNVEKSRKEAKPGFQGQIDVNLSLTQNTKQIFETGTSGILQYHKNQHTVLLLNNLNFMRLEGSDLINNGFQHLRYNYALGKGFTTLEVFTQHQYNSIRLLQRRFLLGGGPRFRIFENEALGLYIAPLVMFEQEKLNDEENSVDNRFKGDLYISATYTIEERINFSHATYYQPDFSDFSQYRISSDTGFEFEINDRFAFIVTFNLAFDSDPPLDIPDLFYTLKNGIKYNF
jgi:putative salt-induced outer membrane protein YdiY